MFIIYIFFFCPSRWALSLKTEAYEAGGWGERRLENSMALHTGKAGRVGLKEEIEAAALRENCREMTEVWP